MFKTDLSLPATFKKLMKEEGWSFMARLVTLNYNHLCICQLIIVLMHYRGLASNVTAVAVPVAVTIFMTDVLKGMKYGYK